jgi:hypothetical protein
VRRMMPGLVCDEFVGALPVLKAQAMLLSGMRLPWVAVVMSWKGWCWTGHECHVDVRQDFGRKGELCGLPGPPCRADGVYVEGWLTSSWDSSLEGEVRPADVPVWMRFAE